MTFSIKFFFDSLAQFLQIFTWAFSLVWINHKFIFSGLISTMLLSSVTPASLALVGRALINALVSLLDQGMNNIVIIYPWLVLGFIVTIIDAASNGTNLYYKQRLGDELSLGVTLKVLEQAATLDLTFFEDPASQDMLAQAQKNASNVFAQFINHCLTFLQTSLQMASLLMILLFIEPLVVLVLMPVALLYLLYQLYLAHSAYHMEYSRTTKRRWINYFTRLLTTKIWIPEIKLLQLAPVIIDKFRTLTLEFLNQNRLVYGRHLLGNINFAILATGSFYLLFIRVIQQAFAGSLTVGDVAIYSGATLRLRTSLQTMIQALRGIHEQYLNLIDLQKFLQVQATENSVKAYTTLNGQPGEIIFDQISFAYANSSQPALVDISFRLAPGETVAIVGENGAGKSTLVKLLARLYEPTAGSISFDGVNIQKFVLADWQGQISFVFQDFVRYEATVRDNIAYGNWTDLNQNKVYIQQIARLAQVDDLIMALPQQYDTLLGWRFGEHTLSGGQWQRLALARAFARQESLLFILDEPTSNLDVRAEYELFAKFRQLAAGRTSILISHRFSTVMMADRILVLDQGHLIEMGTHEDLLAQGGHYASLYHLQNRQI